MSPRAFLFSVPLSIDFPRIRSNQLEWSGTLDKARNDRQQNRKDLQKTWLSWWLSLPDMSSASVSAKHTERNCRQWRVEAKAMLHGLGLWKYAPARWRYQDPHFRLQHLLAPPMIPPPALFPPEPPPHLRGLNSATLEMLTLISFQNLQILCISSCLNIFPEIGNDGKWITIRPWNKLSAQWTRQPKCDSQTSQNRNYSGRRYIPNSKRPCRLMTIKKLWSLLAVASNHTQLWPNGRLPRNWSFEILQHATLRSLKVGESSTSLWITPSPKSGRISSQLSSYLDRPRPQRKSSPTSLPSKPSSAESLVCPLMRPCIFGRNDEARNRRVPQRIKFWARPTPAGKKLHATPVVRRDTSRGIAPTRIS